LTDPSIPLDPPDASSELDASPHPDAHVSAFNRGAWTEPATEQVAPGVHRIPLPLPGDGLKAVNIYAIEQPDGLVLIDSGWAIGGAREQLEEGLGRVDRDLGDITRFLVTHAHRDHYELGLKLRKIYGMKVSLGIGEQPSVVALLDPPSPQDSPVRARLWRAGAHDLMERMRIARENRPHIPVEWGLPDEWLEGNPTIELDGRSLEAIATPGHTQGHVVFLDRANNLLFAGDHVLPHITPSIGFEQALTRSMLADYLDSLAIVKGLPDTRLLPAHGPVQARTHERVDELLSHHDERLALSLAAVRDGASTGWEVAVKLPWTSRHRSMADLDPFNAMLATNETVAHLDVLVDRGELTAALDDDGIERYAIA